MSVSMLPTIFKKIRLSTYENIGSGPIHLPEQILHTSGCWFSFPTLANKQADLVLFGLTQLFQTIAPFFVMCDRSDLLIAAEVKAIHNEQPTLFIYDRYPGGIGLAQRLYEQRGQLFYEARITVEHCRCERGCPSCIGYVSDATIKRTIIEFLAQMEQMTSEETNR